MTKKSKQAKFISTLPTLGPVSLDPNDVNFLLKQMQDFDYSAINKVWQKFVQVSDVSHRIKIYANEKRRVAGMLLNLTRQQELKFKHERFIKINELSRNYRMVLIAGQLLGAWTRLSKANPSRYLIEMLDDARSNDKKMVRYVDWYYSITNPRSRSLLRTSAIDERPLPSPKSLDWIILPPGWWYNRTYLAGLKPYTRKKLQCNSERLFEIEKYKPVSWYFGKRLGGQSYYVAEFSKIACAENPMSGNALYCLQSKIGDWRVVFQRGKWEALRAGARRIIHDPGGCWKTDLERVMKENL